MDEGLVGTHLQASKRRRRLEFKGQLSGYLTTVGLVPSSSHRADEGRILKLIRAQGWWAFAYFLAGVAVTVAVTVLH